MSAFRISRPGAFSVTPRESSSLFSPSTKAPCVYPTVCLFSHPLHTLEGGCMNLSSSVGVFVEVRFPWVSTLLSPAQPKEAIPCIWETWEMSPNYKPHGAPFLAQHVPAVGLGFGWVFQVLLLAYWGLLTGKGWQVGREDLSGDVLNVCLLIRWSLSQNWTVVRTYAFHCCSVLIEAEVDCQAWASDNDSLISRAV